MVFVVSNPVDVLTYLAVKELPQGPQRVFGLGTMLDTTRLRGMLAQQLNVPPTQVSAMMLGEHGDSMVAIWSAAQIAGLPLDKWPGVTPAVIQEVEKRTRGSGAEVIKKKTGAGFAVGVSIADVIHSIALDQRRILPVSTLQTGTYQIRDVCLSVPTVVGRGGILGHVEIELWPKERMGLKTRRKFCGRRSTKCCDDTSPRTAVPGLLRRHSDRSMEKSLDRKLRSIHADPHGVEGFIIADAKDADMAFGIGRRVSRPSGTTASYGTRRLPSIGNRSAT